MILIMAWRNIWRNKARSLIILSSVMIGLFTGIFVLALYRGMIDGRIRVVIEDEVSHLQLHHPEFKKDYEARYVIGNSEELIKSVSGLRQVSAMAPRDIAQGMLSTGTGSNGVEIRGVIPEKEVAVSRLDKKIIEGNYFSSEKRNELLIGKKLFDKMKLKLHNKVVLTFSDKDNNVTSGAFRIAGVFRSANTALDERIVFVRSGELAGLLNIAGSYHELAILLYRNEDVAGVQQLLRAKYAGLSVENWKEISPETELTISTMNQFSLIIIAIIMLALAFGIVNTMLMAILERTHETGMMVALGMNKLRLFTLVLSETIFLTLAGTPAGLLLAWGTTLYISKHGIDTASYAGEVMGSFGYSSVIYPEFPADQLIAVMGIVAATAILSAIFPAVKALRLQPVEALRK
ncbi:MAG: FtsX-like permease family protein [Bacteroidota bacterium]|nr:FtsX-like permease family protein [Bacteroidota bacterium]MDP4218223.1 FtsX-like permease family protein [Bacteroidota bacterium]MDP4246333.1 FtsX-like permease family protein [Bacteroidota bacterium]MDP4256199.1 FtsX-like permease family protein [Bacteroidota bacterium]MDP4260549.1 FtsX-like permease family protein [Bacteroidota bacterium]